MNRILVLLIVLFLSSCKKEIPVIETSKPEKSPTNSEKPRTTTEGKIIKFDSTKVLLIESKALLSFYKSYHFETVWQNGQKRNAFLNVLNKSSFEGLNPKDYSFSKLVGYEKYYAKLKDNELVDYDLLLTQSFQKYVNHLTSGKLNPKDLYSNWALTENKIDVNKFLKNSLETDSLAINLEKTKPNHIVYKRLKKALLLLDQFPPDTLKKIEFVQKIILNDTNKSLIRIKRKLIYWKDLNNIDTLKPIYDKVTFEGIKIFQKRHGIIADGIIGKGTIDALNFTKKQRKRQIIANLERWRWYQKNLGKQYVIVNIPAYKLYLVKENDTIESYKVIVGSAKRKTPILDSKLSYAVFNPTWTVPPTIIREDIIPAASKNKNYFTNKNIKIYNSDGSIISPNNWNANKAKSYRYVQSPGTYNSLGMVKLMFPNNFSVYLHDTNHRNYFEKTNRSLSSGCVRVENVLKLAEYLLGDKDRYSQSKINAILQTGETKNVTFKEKYNVHLLYWTAWSENNKLIFRNDIYNLDADLYAKLRN
jgi:murein L,D-transpeptidase YcbB/YkuD